jgi:hypothetical protein
MLLKKLASIFSIAGLSVASLAGCVTTDSQGKPIARETKSVQDLRARAMAEATLDGGRIVASGRPPIAFLYPGTGWVSVRDVDDNSIIFSGENAGSKTLYSITADGKLTGTVARTADGTGVTEIATVNKGHTFVITYLAGGLTTPK